MGIGSGLVRGLTTLLKNRINAVGCRLFRTHTGVGMLDGERVASSPAGPPDPARGVATRDSHRVAPLRRTALRALGLVVVSESFV
jgi:hypothetical protein